MRFIHFSDTHIGFSEFGRVDPRTGINSREQDVYKTFEKVIQHILQLKPDFVIHAGDLFNTPRPSNRAIAQAVAGLKDLVDAGIPTVVIAGNHEVPRVTAAGSIFELLMLLGIQAVYQPGYHKFTVGDTAIHCIPHLPSPDDMPQVLTNVRLDSNVRFNVLALHCAIRGTGEAYSLSEFNELVVNHEELAGLNQFDYIALGHYHKHLKVAPNAFYSGSIEHFSFREAGYAKGFLEVDLATTKRQFHLVDCRKMIVPKAIVCRNKAAGTIMARIKDVLDKAQTLDGAVLRLELTEIDPAVWFEIDQRQIREWAKDAFELRIEKTLDETSRNGKASQAKLSGLAAEFLAYIKSAKLAGLDRSRLRQMGEEYLTEVEEEVAE